MGNVTWLVGCLCAPGQGRRRGSLHAMGHDRLDGGVQAHNAQPWRPSRQRFTPRALALIAIAVLLVIPGECKTRKKSKRASNPPSSMQNGATSAPGSSKTCAAEKVAADDAAEESAKSHFTAAVALARPGSSQHAPPRRIGSATYSTIRKRRPP